MSKLLVSPSPKTISDPTCFSLATLAATIRGELCELLDAHKGGKNQFYAMVLAEVGTVLEKV